jgi:hypothetical protein
MLVFFGRKGVLKTFFKEIIYLQQLTNFIVPIFVFKVPIFVFKVPIFVFKVPIFVFIVPILVRVSWKIITRVSSIPRSFTQRRQGSKRRRKEFTGITG